MERAVNINSSAAAAAPDLKGSNELEHLSALLGSKFKLLRLLSDSGATRSYLANQLQPAQNEDSNQLISLRVLSERAASIPEQVNLFYVESRAAALLSHPNILLSSEAFATNKFHVAIAERPEDSTTLRDLLNQNGWLDINKAISVAYQLALALHHAHSKGVVHLCIQPDSILIDRIGTVRLGDFGVETANGSDSIHKERSERLPKRYWSPEQASNQPLGFESDLYSLGIVLFEMLTDRTPFDSEDDAVICRKHVTQQPASPQMLRAEVPDPLCEITLDLLAKSTRKRIGSAVQLLSRLDDLIRARSSAPPVTSTKRDQPLAAASDPEPQLVSENDNELEFEHALPESEVEDDLSSPPTVPLEKPRVETLETRSAPLLSNLKLSERSTEAPISKLDISFKRTPQAGVESASLAMRGMAGYQNPVKGSHRLTIGLIVLTVVSIISAVKIGEMKKSPNPSPQPAAVTPVTPATPDAQSDQTVVPTPSSANVSTGSSGAPASTSSSPQQRFKKARGDRFKTSYHSRRSSSYSRYPRTYRRRSRSLVLFPPR